MWLFEIFFNALFSVNVSSDSLSRLQISFLIWMNFIVEPVGLEQTLTL
jgi:hypothetical protein